MKTKISNALLRNALGVALLVATSLASAGTTMVNLTALRSTTTLPDGTSVPMWGYCSADVNGATALGGATLIGGACAAAGSAQPWAPGPTITVPYDAAGISLNIALTNQLQVPTSIVILGQLGGGLGTPSRIQNFPQHAPQTQTTWNANTGSTFTPTAQGARVSSFATEVGQATAATLNWSNLKPGTYIYETGTLPSIQAPMGLYGVLIVTRAPVTGATLTAGDAYPPATSGSPARVPYDSDVALLFSEIDPVHNNAVNAAANDKADITKRFNDPTCSANAKCYPAAVNYTPTYFLINGRAFDKTAPQNSAFALAGTSAAPGSYAAGKVLVRLLNAGLRTHTPAIVGLPVSLVAEDGNFAPGNAKLQNEVLLTAGKTHDVLVTPAGGASAGYVPATYTVFDRQLSLSTANEPGGGMQGFLQIASAGATTGAGALPAVVLPSAVADTFNVPFNTSNATIGNVLLNDIGINNPVSVNLPAQLSLDPGTGNVHAIAPITGPLAFDYCGNGSTTLCAHVTVNPTGGAGPVAKNDAYVSPAVGVYRQIAAGVLANDTDPNGLKLEVDTTSVVPGTCNAVVNVDGSFVATKNGVNPSCTFTYKVKNSVGVVSTAAATVTVSFPAAGSGLTVAVVDAVTPATPITDYRWTIQEDLTFKVDPTGTPSPATRTLGTSFHKSHMPVIATGCVGPVSCGSGQSVRGVVLTDTAATASQTQPGDVALDPAKHYYLTILPGDAGSAGHQLGGSNITPVQIANHGTITVKLQASNALQPAQLSIYIYEDSAPINGQDDLNENGLGGFNIILLDAVGRSGDPAGQQTYDQFGMPLSNALLGRPGCPDDQNKNANNASNPKNSAVNGNIVGAIYTCPNAPKPLPSGRTAADYALAGHALIMNVTPARYDVIAHPAAARQGAGEVWWQTETLEGTPAQDAFTGTKEPVYFQEFGPPGFHTTIGFVNPDHVKQFAKANGLVGTHAITGKITNQHMSRPSDVRQWDSGSYDLLSSTTCQVALNSQGGVGAAIAIASCDRDGNFTLSGLPSGAYELVIWDQWLDQIIQTKAVTVGATDVAMGNIPVLTWFTQYNQNIFQESPTKPAALRGVYRQDLGDTGISNVTMSTRYRDGGMSNQTKTDSLGNGVLVELFPLFNWYVTEADTTRFKQSGVSITVDAGGQTDTTGDGIGLWNSTYKDCDVATGLQPCSSSRIELPGANSYGLQGFIGQRNTINWGRTPYVPNENGGIQGLVVYAVTRPFDDQRYNVQNIWEPLVPRVTVNLYQKVRQSDGTEVLSLVDTTLTSSWDDFVNKVDPATGKQLNLQCPGQDPADPFVLYTLAAQNTGGPVDQFRCYDGWHNWNQVQAAPYDGRYNFPSAAYVAAHPLGGAGQNNPGQTLVSLPPGQYVVETITPPGYEIVKEEDKDILTGDAFVAPAVQQFGPLTNIFILPDQATLNNANPFNPPNADGIQNNATSNLGVTGSKIQFAECVGSLHRVPDFLSVFPKSGLVAPFAGMDRPLCDRKLVALDDQMQASTNFFVFTQAPTAANGTGIILDDASSEFNAAAPDFGEKASVPFVPVSIKSWSGREITRTYSDQWGAYNVMAPSSWTVNPPTPSGYAPSMHVTCINDPGPIAATNALGQWIDANGAVVTDPALAKQITDPQYNPAYSNFCYTLPFMPGRTTYLDTPVLPIAAFASGYNPADCEYPDATPAIQRVDASGTGNFGPYLPATGGTLTIKALGFVGTTDVGVQVANPAYAGPFATSGPTSLRTITRHYGFGPSQGTGSVTLNGVPLTVTSWAQGAITVSVPATVPSGQLVVTASNGKSTVDAVTVTVGGTAPKRVAGPSPEGTLPGAIQTAIDSATPGDLILVDAGTYSELVVMWKPVRLQGVGAASVIINAAKYPTQKLEAWRPMINGLFSVDITTGNQTGPSQVDPLPGQEITGGIVLLEPSVLGTEQGAGVTVLAKDPAAASCTSTAPSTYSTDGGTTFHQMRESNFNCVVAGMARIDGISVTGGDAGGGIYVNGWAHNLEISNNRVHGNAGAFHGGVRIGVPYLENLGFPGLSENPDGTVVGTPTLNGSTIAGWGFDKNVKIHHNAITKNGVVEGPAGGGGAGGGVSICSGSDGYSVDHNWVCGNVSASNGGGIGHIGFSQGGSIAFNQVLFNQSFQQTASTHGGGIAVVGEPPLFGATVTPGSGNLSIDANVIRGNFAEAGHGGGVRLQQANGADVSYFPNTPARWHQVSVTNNIVDNNVAGWAGGGISLSDSINSSVVNNTVVSNDSAGIAGALLVNAQGAPVRGTPNAAGVSSDPTSAQLVGALPNAQRAANTISQPTNFSNNIVWHNRAFYFDTSTGSGRLCNTSTGVGSCGVLADQTSTGQCPTAVYWDLGALGDATATPSTDTNLRLRPTYSVLSSTTGYGGAGTNLSSSDPNLTDVYCNGSRVTPEFDSVVNPPSPKNLQVAATLDEGNNYVNMRYGPLTLAKPTTSSGAVYVPFGNYHIAAAATAANSSAVDHGTPGVSTHDVDNQLRPQGAAWDIGADEFVAVTQVAVVSITPATLTFGNQVLGTTSASRQVTVTNTGNANLVFNAATPAANAGVSISGAFGIAAGTTCVNGGTVAPKTSCVINVTFNPTGTAGAKTGTLTLRDNATGSPQTVALSGNATNAVTVAPNPELFAPQKIGTTSATQTVTFTNNQTVAVVFNAATPAATAGVTITTLGTSGSIPQGEFVIVPVAGTNCTNGSTIPAGGSCMVGVQFKPAGSTGLFGLFGVRAGTLTFRDNAPGSPQTVLLGGMATP